jgi:hypothetical protein
VRSVGVVEPRVVVKIPWARVNGKKPSPEISDEKPSIEPRSLSTPQGPPGVAAAPPETAFKSGAKSSDPFPGERFSYTEKLPEHFRQALEAKKRCIEEDLEEDEKRFSCCERKKRKKKKKKRRRKHPRHEKDELDAISNMSDNEIYDRGHAEDDDAAFPRDRIGENAPALRSERVSENDPAFRGETRMTFGSDVVQRVKVTPWRQMKPPARLASRGTGTSASTLATWSGSPS